MKDKRFRVGKTCISATSLDDCASKIAQIINEGGKGYICVSNMRTVAYANANEEYNSLMKLSLMNTPDGMPLVWLARCWGLEDVHRTMGPVLFDRMLQDTHSGLKHFLLGDTNETLRGICVKYPLANIVGTYSPPFCEVDEFDYKGIARIIESSGADIVWVSLRSPKQDIFGSRLVRFLDNKICIGVGAAFRFGLGSIRQPPKIIQKLGLTGLLWRKWNLNFLKFYVLNSFNLAKWTLDIFWARFIMNEK